LVLSSGAAPFLTGTHLQAGSQIPKLVYGEADGIVDNHDEPANVDVLAASPISCTGDDCQSGLGLAEATIYTASSGAKVFDAGTFDWAWGLDDDSMEPQYLQPFKEASADFQRFTANLLNSML
jgi:hypothetical protein